MAQDISLRPDSPYEEIQKLYQAGFTYEQICAIASLFCAIQSQNFHLINKDFERLLP